VAHERQRPERSTGARLGGMAARPALEDALGGGHALEGCAVVRAVGRRAAERGGLEAQGASTPSVASGRPASASSEASSGRPRG
jgi:hypothetical protein